MLGRNMPGGKGDDPMSVNADRERGADPVGRLRLTSERDGRSAPGPVVRDPSNDANPRDQVRGLARRVGGAANGFSGQ